ncbi:hypothetical protein BDL97_01G125600 [Sphagnum fallax]|nr:hypothetical protein BDL97_01G125600 [Sphagnum fallax]
MAASKYDQGDRAYLKDPISRIGTVEDGAMQATEAGDHERALFLRMQDITNYPIHEAFGDMHMGHGDAKAMLEVEELKGGHHKKSGSHGDGEDTKDMDYEKALDEYGKAWELIAGKEKRKMLRMLAPKDARMASIYSKMAKARELHKMECQQIRGIQGNDEESIQLYEKSLACHEKADKPNVAAIAKTEYELGVIYHKHKKYSDSLDVLDKAVKKCEGKQELGNQPLLLLVKKQQAITLYDGNQVEAAKEKFDELMSLQRMEYGGSSVIVAETLKYLGDVHVALEKRPIAQKYYNRALRILRRRLGCKDETVRQLEHYVRQLNFFM